MAKTKDAPTPAQLAKIPDSAGYGFMESVDGMKRFSFTKYMPFPPGTPIVGLFGGYGGAWVVADMNKPGRFRRIHTWLLKINDGLTWRVPGSAQINRQLPHYPIGQEICIIQNAEKVRSKKGNQVNDFMVSDPPTGWTRLPSVKLEDFDGAAGDVDPDELNPAEVLDTEEHAA